MFEKGDEDTINVSGAEKRAIAARMRQMAAESANILGGARGGQAVPVTIVFALSVLTALFATEASLVDPSTWRVTGIGEIDHFLAGSGGAVASDAESNFAALVLARGLLIFIGTGLMPLLAFLSLKFFSRRSLSPLVVSWGALVFLLGVWTVFS